MRGKQLQWNPPFVLALRNPRILEITNKIECGGGQLLKVIINGLKGAVPGNCKNNELVQERLQWTRWIKVLSPFWGSNSEHSMKSENDEQWGHIASDWTHAWLALLCASISSGLRSQTPEHPQGDLKVDGCWWMLDAVDNHATGSVTSFRT